MFRYFQYKFMLALFVAGVGVFFQNMELDPMDKNLVAEKSAVVSKSRIEIYEFMRKLENLPLWFPNIKKVNPLDSKSETSVGKKYRQLATFLFGISETTTTLTVATVQPLSLIEYYSDNLLKELSHIELTSVGENKTKIDFKIYSMRKSILFKYTIGMLYQFYYSQLVREGLFALQFLLKKN